MNELICNLHIHSTYSDGSGTYAEIANAALKTEVDVIILTDHNVLVKGLEGYREGNSRKILVLSGEEIHDQNRDPQKNHTLVIGAEKEMASYAANPQTLINEASKSGGLTFLAHPFEFALPMINEPDISWVSWEVDGFTGLELWNGLSEFKTVTRSLRDGLKYIFLPELMPHAPLQSALDKWDDLLKLGKKVNVVCGADAHAIKVRKSILRRTVYPYEFHFSTLNNHLLCAQGLSGDLEQDKSNVYNALRNGNSFIGYDLPASTRGFRFTVEDGNGEHIPGESARLDMGATALVQLPEKTRCKLIHNGRPIFEHSAIDRFTFTLNEPGAYRVESSIYFLGKWRGWIYSNPIYALPARRRKVL